MPMTKLRVCKVLPRDCFEDCTVPVSEWLSKGSQGSSAADKTALWAAAQAAVCEEVYADEPLRLEPHVGYDPVNDQLFFIFKLDNNGTTYLVSELPLEGMQKITN